MSKNVAMFVDVANMYYAARGQDVDVDYVALLKHATKGRDLIRAYAYTGLDPENENQRKFIDFLGKNGYKPVIKDIRKFGDGRMKANLDIELVVDLFRLADRMDIAVIVSGDGDFAPAIKALQDKGVRCEVISFKPNTSSDLIAVADEFMDIMKVASISRKEGRAVRDSMSAPEMPAKEVNPEFGFREASPSVAAAALAALKGGAATTAGGNGRRTRSAPTTRRSTGPGVAGAAPASAESGDPGQVATNGAEPAAEAGEEARRRRRRRGGRGRGRTRREDDTTPVAGGGEEIGWEELDDLSQIDGLEVDREYSFEEADPATLAELGLTEDEVAALSAAAPTDEDASSTDVTDAVASPEVSPDEPKTPRRRATRSKKADAAPGETSAPTGDAGAPADEAKPARRRTSRAKQTGESAPATDAADEPKPARRRTTRAKQDDAASDGPASGEAQAKPARRRSTRSAATSSAEASSAEGPTADASGSDEPQGIWGRFRSARKPRGSSSSS